MPRRARLSPVIRLLPRPGSFAAAASGRGCGREPLHALFLLLAAPLLGASIPAPPEDPADIRKSAERIGSFTLELEEYRDSKGGETPRQWKKVRMLWSSADGLSRIQLLDNGYTLTRSYETRAPDGRGFCAGGDGLSQYGPGSHFETYALHYAEFLKACTTDPARSKAYQAELRQALPFYPAAGARLKALATAAFGGLAPRCIRYKGYRGLLPEMYRECARHSKPVTP